MDDCRRILKQFGSRLYEYEVRENAVIDLVAKYCDGTSLKHLLIGDNIDIGEMAVKLKSILNRAPKITIYNTALMDINYFGIISATLW